MSGPVRIDVTGGGEPSPQEAAVIAAVVEFLMAEPPAGTGDGDQGGPAASEWALQGRMSDLHWGPLSQRWPGEPPGRSWRRVLS